jgi:hypothetical protein
MKNPIPDQNNKTDADVYKTADLYQSAYLLTKGISLIGSERADGYTLFMFRNEERIKLLVQEYFSDVSVPVLSYKGRLRELKALLFDGPRRGRR